MPGDKAPRSKPAKSSSRVRGQKNVDSEFLPLVGETANTISRPVCRETELLSAATHVAPQSGRISCHESEIGYVTSHYRTSANQRIPAYFDATKNGRIGTDARTLPH